MGKTDERGVEPEGHLQIEVSKLLKAVDRLIYAMIGLKKVIFSRVVYFEMQPGIFRKMLVRRYLEVFIDADGFFFQGSLAEVCRKVHKHMEKLVSEHKKLRDRAMLRKKPSTQ